MNKRKLRLEKYGISSKRYKELCGFCEQYPDWKIWLAENHDSVKSKTIDGMPYPPLGHQSDQTAALAMKRANIEKKVNLIDRLAKEAGEDLADYIIESVCYEHPFWYIRDIMNAPISRAAFYDKRKYFFWLLDKEK